MGKLSELYTQDDLFQLLEQKHTEYNNVNFIKDDPISIVHRFEKKEDIEIMGLLMATIAWGNRKNIINSGENLVKILQHQPYEFITNATQKDLSKIKFVHRTFNANDLRFFLSALQNIYQNFQGLENSFGGLKFKGDIKQRISLFREKMLFTKHEKRSEKHISDPMQNSACKRLNMFLRWMVRKDKKGVDFGIWKSIQPAELAVPLDVHTGRIARALGLITRKQDDWKALDELMHNLKKFDAKDPAKYDFALFGIGAYELKKEQLKSN